MSTTSARIAFSRCSVSGMHHHPHAYSLRNGGSAPLAQWIEHLPSKQRVGGSNPSRGAIRTHSLKKVECRGSPAYTACDSRQDRSEDAEMLRFRTQRLAIVAGLASIALLPTTALAASSATESISGVETGIPTACGPSGSGDSKSSFAGTASGT